MERSTSPELDIYKIYSNDIPTAVGNIPNNISNTESSDSEIYIIDDKVPIDATLSNIYDARSNDSKNKTSENNNIPLVAKESPSPRYFTFDSRTCDVNKDCEEYKICYFHVCPKCKSSRNDSITMDEKYKNKRQDYCDNCTELYCDDTRCIKFKYGKSKYCKEHMKKYRKPESRSNTGLYIMMFPMSVVSMFGIALSAMLIYDGYHRMKNF